MIQKRAFRAIAWKAFFFYAYTKGGEDVEKFERDLERLKKQGFCREYLEILRTKYVTEDPVAVHEYVRTVLDLCEERKRNEE